VIITKTMMKRIAVTGIAAVVAGCSIYAANYLNSMHKAKKNQDDLITEVKAAGNADDNSDTRFSHAAWNALHDQNQDFKAWLELDNGTMSLPVVQAADNNAYLRHGFDKAYSVYGTPFLDAENDRNDDNLMIYGHSIDYGPQIMFTPLMNYTDQDTFNQNHTITIWWEDTKEQYSITNAYYLTERMLSSYSYAQLVFPTEESFNKWIEIPDQNNLIQAEQSAKYGDKLLTLQTCKPNTNAATKLIVIAKRISDTEYE